MIQFELVIADTAPLISLARSNVLYTLFFVFSKDEIRLVLTDFVEFEVTRNSDNNADAKQICEFLTKNSEFITIKETQLGKVLIQHVKLMELFDVNEQFRQMMIENKTEPQPIPKEIGELSVIAFANELIENTPDIHTLMLVEDDFVLKFSEISSNNVHFISIRKFLDPCVLFSSGLMSKNQAVQALGLPDAEIERQTAGDYLC